MGFILEILWALLSWPPWPDSSTSKVGESRMDKAARRLWWLVSASIVLAIVGGIAWYSLR